MINPNQAALWPDYAFSTYRDVSQGESAAAAATLGTSSVDYECLVNTLIPEIGTRAAESTIKSIILEYSSASVQVVIEGSELSNPIAATVFGLKCLNECTTISLITPVAPLGASPPSKWGSE
jgi:hypothetical protein